MRMVKRHENLTFKKSESKCIKEWEKIEIQGNISAAF